MPKTRTNTPGAVVPSFRIVADNPATWPAVGTVYSFEVPAGDVDPRTGDVVDADVAFRETVAVGVAPTGGVYFVGITPAQAGRFDAGTAIDGIPLDKWNEHWAPHVQESRLAEPETVGIGPVPAAAADIAVEPDLPDRQAGDVGLVPRLGIVDIDQIIVGDDARLRRSFDETALVQLGESMSGLGQLQAIVVHRLEQLFGGRECFTLIAGERRLKAAVAAGATTIEAKIFCNLTDRQIADMRLAENLDRKDLTHVEVAAALHRASEAGESVAQLAGRIHKSDDFVREHLRLMALCPAVLDLVDSGVLPSKQAAVIARLKDPDEQIKVAATALGAGGVKKTKTGWRIDGPRGWVTSLAHLASPSGQGPQKILSISGVADEVAGKLGDLAGAGAEWPKDVEYAKRRPCAGCEHNSATSPALFADAAVSAAGSGGHCADKKCFQAKRRAWAKDPKNVKAVAKKKAAKKAADQTARGGAEAARRKDRPFPESPAEHLACLTHAYGIALSEAIVEFVRKGKRLPADAAETALAVVVAASVARHGSVYLELELPAGAGKLMAALAAGRLIAMPAGIAIAALKCMHANVSDSSAPEYFAYNGHVANVPTPKAAMERIDILEVLAKRWRVTIEAARPGRVAAWHACRTASAQRWRAMITGAKKSDDAIAAIHECDDVGALRELAQGTKTLKGEFIEAVIERLDVLAKKAVPMVDMSRAVATKVIASCKDVALLVAAQDLGLTGDWRRAAVAKRIQTLVWPTAKAGKKKAQKKRRTTKGTEGTKKATKAAKAKTSKPKPQTSRRKGAKR